MNLFLILALKFPKKRIMKVLRIENYNMTKIFNLLIVYFN